MNRVTVGALTSALALLILAASSHDAGAKAASQAPVAPCTGLRLQAGTLQSALTSLGAEGGFEVTFGNPGVAKLEVKAGPLDGKTCLAAMTRFLEELNLSFALVEGPGESIKKIVVVDFKAKAADASAPAEPETPEVAPEATAEEAPAPEASPEPRKDREPPTEDELIDMGDGMKMYKIPPPYVPMSPGLVPPNATVAGAEVLGESYHGDETAPPNAVLPAAPLPGSRGSGRGPGAPTGPVPPNVPQPGPKPTPQP